MARTALGFQDDNALLTPGPVRDHLIQQMVRQHAMNVRLNAFYGKVKQQGYGALDDAVNALTAAGIKPQLTIIPTPRYMKGAPSELSYKNSNPALMGAFAQEVASHFRGRVGRYSIGNEPNYSGFNYGANTDPKAAGRRYREQYQAGYAGIKKVDPGAAVMLGEMTSTPNAKAFLASVLAGKPLKTSGFAFHPYETAKKNRGKTTWDINSLQALQDTLAGYKRSGQLQTAAGKAAPLYLTEFGDMMHMDASPARRLMFLARGYAKARAAGARELIQYQVVPTVHQPGTWAWDTSIGDAQGNIPVVNRGLVAQARRRRR